MRLQGLLPMMILADSHVGAMKRISFYCKILRTERCVRVGFFKNSLEKVVCLINDSMRSPSPHSIDGACKKLIVAGFFGGLNILQNSAFQGKSVKFWKQLKVFSTIGTLLATL
ncbi:MAG: hypothetical protein ABIH66_13825 [bacterium]